MHQKLDSIDVSKHSRQRCTLLLGAKRKCLQLFELSLSIEASHFRNLLPINLRRGEAQLFFEGLLQDSKVAVFAKNQRKHQPIIARTYLTIRPVVPGKSLLAPR